MSEKYLKQILDELEKINERLNYMDKKITKIQTQAEGFITKENCERRFSILRERIAGIYYVGGTIIGIVGILTLILKLTGKL